LWLLQEPINETMCGCNDIGAAPGKMGESGHEGDGGCDCQGLTMRGSAYVVVDTVAGAHAARRQLIEKLNFPPTLAFTKAATVKTPSMSAIAETLPPNIKLLTVSSNYVAWNEGKMILRLSHMYQVDEHPTLSKPATVSLASVFSKAGFKLKTVSPETTLTGNQDKAAFEAKKHVWPTETMYENTVRPCPTETSTLNLTQRVTRTQNVASAQTERTYLDQDDPTMTVTINAMEVKVRRSAPST